MQSEAVGAAKTSPSCSVTSSPTVVTSEEDATAYHDTVPPECRQEPTTICGMVCDVWPLLLCQGLDAVLGICWSMVLFSFLRSRVDCQTDTPDSVDKSSSDWSGSDHCSDRCLVAEQAQFWKGHYGFAEYGCKMVFVPILGFLGDVYGRKMMILTNLVGSGVACFALAVAAYIEPGPVVHVLVMLGSAIKGGTECSGPGSGAMFADRYESSSSRGSIYAIASVSQSAFSMAGLGVTVQLMSQNLSDYTPVYLGLGCLLWLTAGLATLILHETLPEDQRRKQWQWKQANPFTCIAVVMRSSYLRHLAAVATLLTAALAVSTIGQAFMTTAYDLTQTEIAMILTACAALFVFFSVASVPLIKKFGNRKIFLVGLCSMTLCGSLIVGAPYSAPAFIACLLPLTMAVIASPALLALISKQVLPHDQAKLQAATMALSLIASAIAQPVYSTLFSLVGSGADCDNNNPDTTDEIDSEASSYTELAWLPFGLAAFFGWTMFAVGVRWLCVFDETDDEKVSGAVQKADEYGVSNRVAPGTCESGSANRPSRIETNAARLGTSQRSALSTRQSAMLDACNVFAPSSRRPSMYQDAMRAEFQSPLPDVSIECSPLAVFNPKCEEDEVEEISMHQHTDDTTVQELVGCVDEENYTSPPKNASTRQLTPIKTAR